MNDDGAVELYRKHRPKSFKELYGQSAAVAKLVSMGRKGAIPHVLLLAGPSGCGKTSVARILKEKLECSDTDFVEIDAGRDRGIETMRSISDNMHLLPMEGKSRIYLLDEVHGITAAASEALLKSLEDTPSHVYFMLCTTDPGKLKKTLRTRCVEIAFTPLSASALKSLILEITSRESLTLVDNVIDQIVVAAEGSARMALQLLHSIMGIRDSEAQKQALLSAVEGSEGVIELARELVKKGGSFKRAMEIVSKLQEDPEEVRWRILAYAKACLMRGDSQAYKVICAFRYNFYETKSAGLVAACYEVFLK